MLEQGNTTRQGNVGLGIAISYFTIQGYIVSIPLNDIQDYDLVVEFQDEGLKKIQVKTTRCVERGKYKVELRSKTKGFMDNTSDYLFVVNEDGIRYLIPKENVRANNAIVLGDNYSQYIV